MNNVRYAHDEGYADLCFAENNKFLTTGGDGYLKIWKHFNDLDPASIHVGENCQALVFKNNIIYVVNHLNELRKYDLVTYEFLGVLVSFLSPIASLCINNSATHLICGAFNSDVHLIEIATLKSNLISGHNGPILHVSCDPLEQFFVSSSCDGTARFWSLQNFNMVKVMVNLHKSSSNFYDSISRCKIAWHKEGILIAVPCEKAVQFYERATWLLKFTIYLNSDIVDDEVTSICAFSPDGWNVLIATSKNKVYIHSIITKKLLFNFSYHTDLNICALKWNPSNHNEIIFINSNGYMVNINPVIWNDFNESSISFSATSIVKSNNFETPGTSTAKICEEEMADIIRLLIDDEMRTKSLNDQLQQFKLVTIRNLSQNITNFFISGIVITKREIREIVYNGTRTYVLNFVLRDSLEDLVNVSCWGQKDFVEKLNLLIQIASYPVNIYKPIVNKKNNKQEMFFPWTISDYCLAVKENDCILNQIEIATNKYNHELNSGPIREHDDFFTINDLLTNIDRLKDLYVNMLFVVRQIGFVELLKSKNDGSNIQKLDIIIFDNSCAEFVLTIWDRELIREAQTWNPMKHVIFATEVKLQYDVVKNQYYVAATGKTIFIVYPDTQQGLDLYQYAKTAILPNILSEIDKIRKFALKCNIEELNQSIHQSTLLHDFIVLKACVTEFNIDVNFNKYFVKRCKNCYSIIPPTLNACLKRECNHFKNDSNNYNKKFEIKITIADHSSMLKNVRCKAKHLEKFLGTEIHENLSNEQIMDIKWKLLLDKFVFIIKVNTILDYNVNKTSYIYNLVHMELPD